MATTYCDNYEELTGKKPADAPAAVISAVETKDEKPAKKVVTADTKAVETK